MMKISTASVCAAAAFAAGGCTSVTGLDASDSFSCPRAQGYPCSSLSNTYLIEEGSSSEKEDSTVEASTAAPTSDAASRALPKRILPQTASVWIAPWLDAEGDLHDACRIYIEVSPAGWAAAKFRDETAFRTASPLSASVRMDASPKGRGVTGAESGAARILEERRRFEEAIASEATARGDEK